MCIFLVNLVAILANPWNPSIIGGGFWLNLVNVLLHSFNGIC